MAAKRHLSLKPPSSPSASADEEDTESGKDGSTALESTQRQKQQQQQSLPTTMESSEEGDTEDVGGDDDDQKEEETVEKDGSAARELTQQRKNHHQRSLSAAENPEISRSDSDYSAERSPYPSRAAVSSIEPISSRPMDGSPMILALPHDQQSQKRKREEDHKSPKGKKNSRKYLVLQDGTPPKRNGDSSAGLENGDNQKKPMFQKIWSDEDVEAILCGMVEYCNKNSTAPGTIHEMIPFLDFVQGRLQIKITKQQLQDKLRRLKKKFETNAARIRKDADFIFSSPHDQICYELSKSLWDSKEKKPKDKVFNKKTAEDENQSGGNKDQDTKKKSKSIIEVSKQSGSVPNKYEDTMRSNLQFPYLQGGVHKLANELSCGVAIMKSLHELDTEKASALDEKVKKLKMKEIKLHLRKMDLVKDLVKLIHDGLSSTG